MRFPSRYRPATWVVPAIVACSFCLTAARASADETTGRLLVGYSPDVPKQETLLKSLEVRPNVEQPIYFFVKNLSNATRKYTVVVGGLTADVSVAADKTERVSFVKPVPPPAAPPAPAAAPPPAEPKIVWTELKETPAVLAVQLLADGKEIDAGKITFSLPPVSSYLSPPVLRFTAGNQAGKNQLSVTVTAGANFAGPPCIVQMVLPPERVEGLLMPLSRDADLRGILTKPGDEVTLFARNLRFKPGVRPKAEIYLTVDGYQHAYIFETEFSGTEGQVNPRQVGESFRIIAPRYAPAGDKVPVRIEADNCPNPDDDLELALGIEREDGRFEKKSVTILHGCRDKKVRFSPAGPNGSLLFQVTVSDWITDVDTAGLLGERLLRVRPAKQADAATAKEGRTLITLDSTPPEEVAFVQAPLTGFLGAKVTVQAHGVDPESAVSDVFFFLGKPPADGKLPPTLDVVRGVLAADGKNVWTANIVLPSDKKGPAVIGVLFVNYAGLSAGAVTTVTVLDPRDPAAPPLPGRIEGKVFEGDRPQPKLDVVLKDDKGMPKAKAKTNEKGAFVFEGVPAGNYSVATAKVASQVKGETPVEVLPDKTAVIDVKLLRAAQSFR